MRQPITVTSLKNPTVKATVDLLAKRKARSESGLFAVEGAREIGRALRGGFSLVRLFECPELRSSEATDVLEQLAPIAGYERLIVSEPVFAKLAMREGSDGLVAVFKQRHLGLADLGLPPKPLVLAIHGVEKPGNLGALLRTADGVAVDAVVLLDDTVDLYNPHVVRGSVGAVFGLKVATATSEAFRSYCQAHSIRTIAAALAADARPHYAANYTGGTALLLGSEADGLPRHWIDGADERVMIPMRGLADSLNVSVAGAVILYEALRQRQS